VIQRAINSTKHFVKSNSPTILSAVAITGVVSTAYLASVASIKASEIVKHDEGIRGAHDDPKQRWKERVQLTWRLYIPTAVSGTVTVGCILGSNRISGRRAAAAQAAVVLSDCAFSEYRGHVIEEFGENKDRDIRDKQAADKVHENPPPADLVIAGTGNVLCCELFTGRYFASDMEALRKAQNDLNGRLIQHDTATLDDFYWLIGLQPTSYSCDIGWYSDKMMNMEFTSVLTEDGRPCLAFEYNYTKQLYV